MEKMMALVKLAKLTIVIKEKNLFSFVFTCTLLRDFMLETGWGGNETLILGSDE